MHVMSTTRIVHAEVFYPHHLCAVCMLVVLIQRFDACCFHYYRHIIHRTQDALVVKQLLKNDWKAEFQVEDPPAPAAKEDEASSPLDLKRLEELLDDVDWDRELGLDD